LPTTVHFLEPERTLESVYSGVVGSVEFERSVGTAIDLARTRESFRLLETRGLPRTLREALVVDPDLPDRENALAWLESDPASGSVPARRP
jgi:hypothetical protein